MPKGIRYQTTLNIKVEVAFVTTVDEAITNHAHKHSKKKKERTVALEGECGGADEAGVTFFWAIQHKIYEERICIEYSRERLLIPISNPDILVNGTCYMELDSYAKREVAVLYLEGGPDRKSSHLLKKMTSEQGKRKFLIR